MVSAFLQKKTDFGGQRNYKNHSFTYSAMFSHNGATLYHIRMC